MKTNPSPKPATAAQPQTEGVSVTTSRSDGPSNLATKIQAALSGVQTNLAAGSTFQIGGTAMTQSQIAAELSGYLPTFAAVGAAKAQYEQAVAARTTLEPQAREFLVNLRAALVAFFKRGNPILSQFGMGTGAPGKQSPTTMVVAAAARLLTRQKRGTIGKNEKQAIKVVGSPVVTVGGAQAVAPGTISATPPAVEAALAAAQAAAQAAGGSAPAPVAPAPAAAVTK